MKTKSIALVSVLFLSFIMLTSANNLQEKQTLTGVYDGKEDYGYNFVGVDEEENEFTMTFQKIDAELLKNHDLVSNTLISSKFLITYTTEIKNETDEDGFTEELEIYTIVGLKKL